MAKWTSRSITRYDSYQEEPTEYIWISHDTCKRMNCELSSKKISERETTRINLPKSRLGKAE